jgi:hypothetical protein
VVVAVAVIATVAGGTVAVVVAEIASADACIIVMPPLVMSLSNRSWNFFSAFSSASLTAFAMTKRRGGMMRKGVRRK